MGVFKGVGIRKMPNLHFMSKGFVRLTSLFSFENPALKTRCHNSVRGRGRRSQIAVSSVVPVSSGGPRSLQWLLEQPSQDRPIPEATEENASQAAGYFAPKPLIETGHLINVELCPPYLTQLWMCL